MMVIRKSSAAYGRAAEVMRIDAYCQVELENILTIKASFILVAFFVIL